MRKLFPLLLFPVFLSIACNKKHVYPVVSTFAGSGLMGFADGLGTQAQFANLMGIAADTMGNLYVADSHNNVIRKIDAAGNVITLAGSGVAGSKDGRGTAASFFYPGGIATDNKGNVYVADTHNSLIRKIDAEGIVTTIAGKRPGNYSDETDSTVKLDNPSGIAVDANGNIYVADWNNDDIRKITPAGKVITFAGSGTPGALDSEGAKASFYLPGGIAVDVSGNVYVSDTYNNMIRKITPGGSVTTLAGHKKKGFANGKSAAASFLHPQGIAVDAAGNLYVADMGNNCIRRITPSGIVSSLAGSGRRGAENGRDTVASFYKPYGVAVNKDGSVYVADFENNLVRKISF
jgi:serine/threonine protein kinase, bacterial